MPYYDDRGGGGGGGGAIGASARDPDPIDAETNAYKQRKQREYYQALEHDAKSAPIANSYTVR